jgi:hypothetical protein
VDARAVLWRPKGWHQIDENVLVGSPLFCVGKQGAGSKPAVAAAAAAPAKEITAPAMPASEDLETVNVCLPADLGELDEMMDATRTMAKKMLRRLSRIVQRKFTIVYLRSRGMTDGVQGLVHPSGAHHS